MVPSDWVSPPPDPGNGPNESSGSVWREKEPLNRVECWLDDAAEGPVYGTGPGQGGNAETAKIPRRIPNDAAPRESLNNIDHHYPDNIQERQRAKYVVILKSLRGWPLPSIDDLRTLEPFHKMDKTCIQRNALFFMDNRSATEAVGIINDSPRFQSNGIRAMLRVRLRGC
jgi:hypothetical protein